MSRQYGSTVAPYMGTKPASFPSGSPAEPTQEVEHRSESLASVGEAVEVLRTLDLALGRTDDDELGRLASDVREGERALEEWARQIEAFRASKQLFDAGILPDPAGRPRGVPNELVLTR